MMAEIVWFKDCSYKNKHLVGGKCSSLGELYHLSETIHFQIADGFAITTVMYDEFLRYNDLTEVIADKLADIDIDNILELDKKSASIRELISSASLSVPHTQIICDNYNKLCTQYNIANLAVAVRSSAIAEDLANASFAGQQDTYLNIMGYSDLISSVTHCFASLFNSRAISYRKRYNIQMDQVKISVAIQKMVRSDIGSAGVAFSIDTESGYDKAVVINGAFGLGELVVSGLVLPDEFILDKRTLALYSAVDTVDPILMKKMGNKHSKIVYNMDDDSSSGTVEVGTSATELASFSLTDPQIVTLGSYVLSLEASYSELLGKSIGVDVEWALDGIDKQIYIIQTRPETVHSNDDLTTDLTIHKYILDNNKNNKLLISGVAVGDRISTGKIKILTGVHEFSQFCEGDILVTDMTTPDWEPIMKISSGIITNKGGRTCHAAIIARELQLNAIVGTGYGTAALSEFIGQSVTLSCADGEVGNVYEGVIDYHVEKITVSKDLKLPVKLMMNVGNPESCFSNANIPNSGVGLARMEFIISNYIKVHPLALCDYPNIREDIASELVQFINTSDTPFTHNLNILRGLRGPISVGKSYFIEQLARGISKIASAFYPNDVIVRLSDFKSNEYKNLLGGELYEPNEENPMIGWRGASRYYSKEYEPAFELECLAIKYAREVMMMSNVVVMIPFCRTPTECRQVIQTMEKYGLTRGILGLKIYLMCEIPSNVIEADIFSPMIDGVSIGGNDLLQLTLGVDRDSERIAYLSDDKNTSYRRMISMAIKTYKSYGVKVGFCGQQPSDSIEFCRFLIDEGIDSISVTPDSALRTIKNLGSK